MIKLQLALSRKLMNITGLDIFKNTRRRDYVEARALLMFVFHKYLGMTKTAIAEYFVDNGKPTTHCTVIHHLKNWDITVKFNPILSRNLNDVLGGTKYMTDGLKRQYIQDKVPLLTKDNIDELYKKSLDMYEDVLIDMEANPVEKYNPEEFAN
tara:strand:+ start:12221 stop:12679 length:459 start_codon:yes stop_codon:yes gene_type:complete